MLYVDHGDVATSAGTGAGIDLCLHLVRADHGAAYASQIARSMVLPPHREGSQRQYAIQPAPARPDDSLAALLEWAAARLGTPLTLAVLAGRAGLSSRTLARRFAEQLGHQSRPVAAAPATRRSAGPAGGDRPAGGRRRQPGRARLRG